METAKNTIQEGDFGAGEACLTTGSYLLANKL
jgi:hypothetical protein